MGWGSSGWVDLIVVSPEQRKPIWVGLDLPPMLVDEPVVVTTQQDQIVQIDGPALGPVSAMVTVNAVSLRTAAEPAAAIAEPELTPQPGRYEAGAMPDPQHPTMVGDHTLHHGVHVAPDPIQGVLDREPPLPKRIESILGGRWPGSTGGPIQGGIRQPGTLGDQRLLGGRCGQLRDRIHLIQTHFPGGEPLPEQGQISKTTGDPNQLPSGRMTEIEPGRDPLGQIPRPIDQELLGDIGLDQPVTNLSVEHGESGEQLRQHLLHLIVGEPLPLHVINVGRGCDRNGPETDDREKNQEICSTAAPLTRSWARSISAWSATSNG